MWGRFYWGKKKDDGRRGEGIVVLFAWVSSQERHLKPYVDLYWSLGWDCLICHVDFLTLFFPEKATELARGVLDELIKDDYRLLTVCISGQIYDSCPVNFSDDLDLQFVLHPSFLKMTYPPKVLSWMAKAFASGLDSLFLNSFEAQRAEYWQTLYSSASMGPFLILCSEDDKLAPYQTVSGFAQCLQELGADVSFIKWSSSSHVAHYRHNQDEYRAAVSDFLSKARLIFSNRQLNQAADNKIPESVAAIDSNESLRTFAFEPSDHFFVRSSTEFSEIPPGVSPVDEQKGGLFQIPSIKPQGVLSQILFDVCVPKNIEGWDIKPISSLNSAHRRSPFNPIKCIRRSRL